MNNCSQAASKLLRRLVSALVITIAAGAADAGLIISESFETDGEGTRYVSSGEFRQVRSAAYFMRSNNAQASMQDLADNIPTDSPDDRRYSINPSPGFYTGSDGAWVWVAEQVNVSGRPHPATITLNTVNIASYSEPILFKGLFGASNLLDSNDYLRVSYSLDGGDYVQGLYFATVSAGTNLEVALDIDNNGRGDPGPNNQYVLGSALKEFSFFIPNGNTLSIRIEVASNAAHDEFGFDFLRVYVPEPAAASVLLAGAMLVMRRRR